MKLICPLFSSSHRWRDCLKEECAWWSQEMDQCDPTGLLPWVSKLEGITAEIRDKMCGEGRFRK